MKTLFIYIAIIFLPLIANAQDYNMDNILGKENAALLNFQKEFSTDADQVDYLRQVGRRLELQLDEHPFHYRFYLVKDEVPSSYSLPGGYVYITTGLIPVLQNEDELAYILAHEMMHAQMRHHIKRCEQGVIPDVVAIPGNLLTTANRKLGTLVNAPINKYEAIVFHSYGRKFENDADKEGIALMAKAGYDPHAMFSALDRISKYIEISSQEVKDRSFFAEHPQVADRIQAVDKTLAELDWEPQSPIHHQFFAEFDGILLGNNPYDGVLLENQYLNPEYDFCVEFPAGWSATHIKSDVGAYDAKNNSAILVTLDIPTHTPKDAGDLFVQRLGNKCKTRLVNAENYSLNGEDAYKVSFECKSNGRKLQASIIWVRLEDKLVRLMGVSPEYMAKHVEQTALSLRSLTINEMLTFNANYYQVVNAREGENLEALCNRLGDGVNKEMVALINAKDNNEMLKAGEPIKIVVEQEYGLEYDYNDARHMIVSL